MPRARLPFLPVTVSVFLALFASQGCGGDDSGSSSSATDSSAFAAEYCALYRPCCTSASLPVGEQPGCRSFFGSSPPLDASAVQACLDAYKEQAKSADFCGLMLPQPEPCKRAFAQNGTSKGTKKPGEACSSTSDCASSTAGDVSCGNVCQVATHAKAGDACVGTVYAKTRIVDGSASGSTLALCYRSDGVTCDGGTCKAIVAPGGACSGDASCDDASFCSSGQCAAKVSAGASCAASPSACDAASYCDTFGTKKCKSLVPEGGACDTNDQCTTGFCYPDKCGTRSGSSLALLLYCQ